MRRNVDVFEHRTCLVGTICVDETHYGAPIDTQGFAGVIGILACGAIGGTGGNTGSLAVKFQEGATVEGTGSAWTDIANGAINGTMAFGALTVNAGSSPLVQAKLYERFDDNNRSRYIRPHAALTGTDSVNVTYAVSVLLIRPVDTLYITNPSTTGTGNPDFSQG